MPKVPITTTIDLEQYKIVKNNGWKMSNVITAGIGSLMKPSVLGEKINDQDNTIKQLLSTVAHLRQRVRSIEDRDFPEVSNGQN
jgi:hypothetical protein